VATWVSLFQTEEENLGLMSSEVGQYSCVKLLREMEALESDADEEISILTVEDVEMMNIPESLCSELVETRNAPTLPDDIYTLPKMMNITQELPQRAEPAKPNREKKRREKEKWGPILVEPRPSRSMKDGRIVLERAQDMKKKTNLEEPNGISHNPLSALSSDDIADIAEIAVETGIVLGRNLKENKKSLLEVIETDNDRKLAFGKSCSECQVKVGYVGLSVGNQCQQGDDALCTHKNQTIRPQMVDLSDGKGKWTFIANRKK
jgi:hypothetical protein